MWAFSKESYICEEEKGGKNALTPKAPIWLPNILNHTIGTVSTDKKKPKTDQLKAYTHWSSHTKHATRQCVLLCKVVGNTCIKFLKSCKVVVKSDNLHSSS